MDEGEIVISNIDKTSVATISNNNDGSQNSAKGNAFVQNLKKYKEWYLMIGLAIVILALALVAFALHILWCCWWCCWWSIRVYKCYGYKKY